MNKKTEVLSDADKVLLHRIQEQFDLVQQWIGKEPYIVHQFGNRTSSPEVSGIERARNRAALFTDQPGLFSRQPA